MGSFVFFHLIPSLALFGLWWLVYINYKGFFTEQESLAYIWAAAILTVIAAIHILVLAGNYQNFIRWNINTATGLSIIYVAVIIGFHLFLESYTIVNLPEWRQPLDYLIYSGAALIPAILHTITLYALGLTGKGALRNPWINLFIAFLLPLSIYLVFTLGLFRGRGFNMNAEAIILTCGLLTVVFIYMLIRAAVIWARKYQWSRPGTLIKVVITAALPLGCLIFNNQGFGTQSGIVGNFSNYWFYILALLNGLVISLPLSRWVSAKTSFAVRVIMLPFSLYFFVALAPLLPFALLLSIALGLGLLLLTPTVVLWLHVISIREDILSLKGTLNYGTLVIAGLAAFLVLPASVHFTYLYQKAQIENALDYLVAPQQNKIDYWEYALTTTVTDIRKHQSPQDFFLNGRKTPILDSWHNKVTLNGLQLSDANSQKISRIFLGKNLSEDELDRRLSWTTRPENSQVKLTKLTAESSWNKDGKYWQSEVHLNMTNTDEGMREYLTHFSLPNGSFISDYYLYVGDEKKKGILAERKAATWVYDRITRQRLDPGLFRYMENGELELRVYPFTGKVSRKSGFTIIHKQPFELTIDDQQLILGSQENTSSAPQLVKNSLYIPAAAVKTLPLGKRKPRLAFILDMAENNYSVALKLYKKQIEDFLTNHPELQNKAEVLFVNHSIQRESLAEVNWERDEHTFEGGFFLTRAIQTLLIKQLEEDFYYVPVVLSSKLEQAVLENSFTQVSYAFPELDSFYHLPEKHTDRLTAYSLINTSESSKTNSLHVGSNSRTYQLPNGKLIHIKNSAEDQVVPVSSPDAPIPKNKWEEGLALRTNWQQAGLGLSAESWPKQVRQSFASQLLTPYTAYMVTEEAWQEELLKQKQEQFVNGHEALDSDTEIEEMPEPEFWLLLACVGAFYLWKKRKHLLLTLGR
jgi:hypothetical protein